RDFIKESFAVWITTQKVFHHLLAMFLSALRQDRIAIMRTDFFIHQLIAKGREHIQRNHLGPHIAVITCLIAAHHMPELSRELLTGYITQGSFAFHLLP